MLAADRECNLHSFRKKLLLDLGFKHKRSAIACQQKSGHRTAIAQFAFPGTFIAGAFFEQTTCLSLVAAVIIPIEEPTVNRLWHRVLPLRAALFSHSPGPPVNVRRRRKNKAADTDRRPFHLIVAMAESPIWRRPSAPSCTRTGHHRGRPGPNHRPTDNQDR